MSSVVFGVTGNFAFTYNKSSASNWSGVYSGADTWSANGSGNYTTSGQGAYSSGSFSLSSFVLDGGSSANYSMSETGWTSYSASSTFANTGNQTGVYLQTNTSYAHSDNWSETDLYHETGTYQGGQWSFASYASGQVVQETIQDFVQSGSTSNSSSLVYTDLIKVLGSGTSGTRTETKTGTYILNGHTTNFTDSPTPTTVTLTGPGLPALAPEQGTAPALGLGESKAWADKKPGASGGQASASGPALGAVTDGSNGGGATGSSSVGTAFAGMGLAGGGNTASPGVEGPAHVTALPLIAGATTGGNVWMGLTGPNLGMGPQGWLVSENSAVWQVVSQAYNDGFSKALSSSKMNPTALSAQAAWASVKASLSGSAEFSRDFWSNVANFAWGVADTLSFGLTVYLRSALNWLAQQGVFGLTSGAVAYMTEVDTTSAAYQLGAKVGVVASLALMLVPGGGMATALQGVAFAGATVSTVQAVLNGDVLGALRGASAMILLGTGLANTSICQLPAEVQVAFKGILAGGMGSAIIGAVGQFQQGDTFGGILSLVEAGAYGFAAAQTCFTGKMLLDVEGGKKRADAIARGDRLWSQPEGDPGGALVLKEVQDVFVRVAPVWNVHVAGQIVETTKEHPFYVEGRGWVPAAFLRIGDLLRTPAGELVPVEGVAGSGRVETVYNWLIAEYHTYYVSASEDGASLWAHNASDYGTRGQKGEEEPPTALSGKVAAQPRTGGPQEVAGPGTWVDMKRGAGDSLDLQFAFSGKEIHYEGGRAIIAEYSLGGVEFDRFQNGVLGEVKGNYDFATRLAESGNLGPLEQLVTEAASQVRVAKAHGLPLEWHVRAKDLRGFQNTIGELFPFITFIPY